MKKTIGLSQRGNKGIMQYNIVDEISYSKDIKIFISILISGLFCWYQFF